MDVDGRPHKSADRISPEQPYFYDLLTASELLAYYAQLSGVPARRAFNSGGQHAARVDSRGAAKVHYANFPKSMLQRWD